MFKEIVYVSTSETKSFNILKLYNNMYQLRIYFYEKYDIDLVNHNNDIASKYCFYRFSNKNKNLTNYVEEREYIYFKNKKIVSEEEFNKE